MVLIFVLDMPTNVVSTEAASKMPTLKLFALTE